MEVSELLGWLTDGLDAESAAKVKAAVERDSVKAKVGGIKAQAEFDKISAKQAELERALQGDGTTPGAAKYQEWYQQNYAQLAATQKAIADFDAKHGQGAFAKLAAGEAPPTLAAAPALDAAGMQKLIDERVQATIQGGYAPKWSELLQGTGTIVQKHLFAGRKKPIDFAKLAELAPRFNGNLEAAYDEYDKPEREAATAVDQEKEIKRRVDEELQKRGASTYFPAGADSGPSPLDQRSKATLDSFDRNALKADLAKNFLAAGRTQ